MAHSYPVTDGDGIKLERHCTGLPYGLFDNFGNLVEVDMTGNYFAEAVGDSDKGFAHVGIFQAAGV
jgi:hypothetical protein